MYAYFGAGGWTNHFYFLCFFFLSFDVLIIFVLYIGYVDAS